MSPPIRPLPVPLRSTEPSLSTASRELTLTEASMPGEEPSLPLRRLAARLSEQGATLIGLMVFGAVAERTAIEAAMCDALGAPAWPVLWVEGASCHGAALAGVQAFALVGGFVEQIMLDGCVLATRYKVGKAEFCWVGGALPEDPSVAPALQTAQAFDTLEKALAAAGFGLGDLVRTWCYNRELLTWYGEFNQVRSARYRGVAFRTGSLPASTGISASNLAGAAIVLAGLAIRPADPASGAHEIGSPLQCPAPTYGSAFSRAMEIEIAGSKRIIISGTASIERGGATVWMDDIHRQIELTMRVVGAILEARGQGWADVTRSIAYFKSPAYVPAFEMWCREHGWANPPCIFLHCDICRDDLLFELEVDAEARRALR